MAVLSVTITADKMLNEYPRHMIVLDKVIRVNGNGNMAGHHKRQCTWLRPSH